MVTHGTATPRRYVAPRVPHLLCAAVPLPFLTLHLTAA